MSRPETLPVTRAFVRGAAIGVLFLTFFGAFWGYYSIVNCPPAPVWIYVVCCLPVVVLTFFGVKQLINAANFPMSDDAEEAARRGKRIGIGFAITFALEIILIAAAAIILGNAGKPLLIPIVIAFIVGAHFIPLAKIFNLRVYYVTGILIIICSFASFIIRDELIRLPMLGIFVAVILWVSAAIVLDQLQLKTKNVNEELRMKN